MIGLSLMTTRVWAWLVFALLLIIAVLGFFIHLRGVELDLAQVEKVSLQQSIDIQNRAVRRWAKEAAAAKALAATAAETARGERIVVHKKTQTFKTVILPPEECNALTILIDTARGPDGLFAEPGR